MSKKKEDEVRFSSLLIGSLGLFLMATALVLAFSFDAKSIDGKFDDYFNEDRGNINVSAATASTAALESINLLAVYLGYFMIAIIGMGFLVWFIKREVPIQEIKEDYTKQ